MFDDLVTEAEIKYKNWNYQILKEGLLPAALNAKGFNKDLVCKMSVGVCDADLSQLPTAQMLA